MSYNPYESQPRTLDEVVSLGPSLRQSGGCPIYKEVAFSGNWGIGTQLRQQRV